MIQPALVNPSALSVPQADVRTLDNGVKMHLLRLNDFEVMRVTFLFRAGSCSQSKPFTATATANLLSEGSTRYTAQQIAERLDYYGSWFDVNADRDFTYISFAMLSKFCRETLSVAEEILLRPAFPEEEVAAYCQKRKQRLQIERRKVDIIAREHFAQALFGEQHPYGISSPESAYDEVTRADLEAFYRAHYTADNCFVVCSGRITAEEEALVAAIAEQLPRGVVPCCDFPAAVQDFNRRIERPEAVQSSIRVGRMLFGRNHPDFVGMQVVASALGGYFGSRLMQNLRERHGYTYGVVAAMVNFDRAGYLAVATQVGTQVTAAALTEIRREIERLRTERMPDEELDIVKRIMAGEMMRILDGPFGIADVTIENVLCGYDNTIIAENLRRIEAMTPEAVQTLAAKYLRPEDLVTVVVGAGVEALP